MRILSGQIHKMKCSSVILQTPGDYVGDGWIIAILFFFIVPLCEVLTGKERIFKKDPECYTFLLIKHYQFGLVYYNTL